jgi:hypothetical protein
MDYFYYLCCNKLNQALLNLEANGITAKIENETIYVCIGDNELEIDFQASVWIAKEKSK